MKKSAFFSFDTMKKWLLMGLMCVFSSLLVVPDIIESLDSEEKIELSEKNDSEKSDSENEESKEEMEKHHCYAPFSKSAFSGIKIKTKFECPFDFALKVDLSIVTPPPELQV